MSIELRFHHTTGRVYRYVQSEPAAVQQLLKLAAPPRVFAEPEILLSGGGIVTVINTAQVTRLDVVTTEPLGWPRISNITAMLLLPDEAALRARAVRAHDAKDPGDAIVVHLAYDMVGGERFYAEIAGKAGHPLEARAKLSRLLRHPPLYFNLSGGGATVVNPTNVVRVLVTATAQRTPTGAWPVNLQSPL